MTHIQDGHEHETERSTVLTLNTPFVEDLTEAQERTLVEALVAVSQEGGSVSELTDALAAHMDRSGMSQPRTVVERMVEKLCGAHEVTIVTDDGRVLHGDPSWTAATVNPDVDSTEDPDHPDRPTWS